VFRFRDRQAISHAGGPQKLAAEGMSVAATPKAQILRPIRPIGAAKASAD
jgi:hypothetical protein